MRLIVTKNNLGAWAAHYIKDKMNNAHKETFVLGLPTGGTVVDMYANLKQLHKEGELSFKNAVTFNMDEYVGLPKEHPQSYHYYMHSNLFDEVDIKPENVHILNGETADPAAECASYEDAITKAGGIDLFLGGVGRNGHIAFNEPQSDFNSRTRLVDLTPSTIEANARFFDNDLNLVPKQALTVGIGTVTNAKEILFLASGKEKAEAVARLAQDGITPQWPVTVLKQHPQATLLVDVEAASLLDGTAREELDKQMAQSPEAKEWTLNI